MRHIANLGFCLILGFSFAMSTSGLVRAQDDFILFLKICDESPKTVRRNCSGVKTLPIANVRTRLYAYLELRWLSPDEAKRSVGPLYLRWEFVPEGGKAELLANANTHETYIWRPSQWSPVTHWDVNQRAYQDRKGIYRFVVFDDLTDWNGSVVEEDVVQIQPDTS